MTDRRLLKVLPGGRASSKPGHDGKAARHQDPHGHYADPYAVPDGRGSPGSGRAHGPQPGPRPGAGLHLLPPIREDGERQLPASQPAVLPAPAAPQAPGRPAAGLAPGESQPGAGGTHNQGIMTGRTTAAGRHRKAIQRTAGDSEFHAKREIHVLRAARLLLCTGEQFAWVALSLLAGAGLVAAMQPRRTLLIDTLIFLASACLVTALAARRRPQLPAAGMPALVRPVAAEPTSTAGAGFVLRSARLRTLALLGWLAGFYVLPGCLAIPYARGPGGGTLTAGLLIPAMSAGAVLALWALAGVGTAYQLGAAEASGPARRSSALLERLTLAPAAARRGTESWKN
jgi:hypothetical protein